MLVKFSSEFSNLASEIEDLLRFLCGMPFGVYPLFSKTV